MLKEIHEQPEALAQSIAGRVSRDDRILAGELDGSRRDPAVTRIDSWPAERVVRRARRASALEALDGLPARLTVGSEFRYSPAAARRAHPRHRRDPVGRDRRHDRPDALAGSRAARIVAVTNTVARRSPREADAGSSCRPAPEIAWRPPRRS
jgi:glucosamine--fructose-6-phosphate aminotransferase (isomerizing)